MTQYRIALDPVRCQSYGKCLTVAAAVFAWTPARKVRLNDPVGAPDEAILRAAKSCPYRAIAVLDAASGETIFPLLHKPAAR